jgi:hypothetical protein
MSTNGILPESPRPQDPNVHVVDYGAESGSTLLPMLISGIVLIIVAMLGIMIFF